MKIKFENGSIIEMVDTITKSSRGISAKNIINYDLLFIEFLIKAVKEQGILGEGYSDEERVQDVIDTIWESYDIFVGRL